MIAGDFCSDGVVKVAGCVLRLSGNYSKPLEV